MQEFKDNITKQIGIHEKQQRNMLRNDVYNLEEMLIILQQNAGHIE